MNIGNFNSQSIDPSESHGFSRLDLDYWTHPETFQPLLGNGNLFDQIESKIKMRRHFPFRKEIQSILKNQYASISSQSKAHEAIELLSHENSFTVICAHQPCLLGGPWYWLYKISTAISLCQQLKMKYEEYNFIPIYFIGNEDHDFDEINHFNIFNHRIAWNEAPGKAVGLLPTNGLADVFEQLLKLFPDNEFAKTFLQKQILNASNATNYGTYYQGFADDLFGQFGLVTFNPNDADAKTILKPIMKREIETEIIFQQSKECNDWIENKAYGLQVNPRLINLFYHTNNERIRIDKIVDDQFSLKDGSKKWTASELLIDSQSNPQNFSPNVLMRPLLQESLFPNLIFVGGGAEISYWMQLKKCFDTMDIPYPIMIRRMSGLYVNKSIQKRIAKTKFSALDFLKPLIELEAEYVHLHQHQYPIDEQLIMRITTTLNEISQQIDSMDQPTKVSIEAELHKIKKSLESINSKQSRYIKHKHDNEIQHIQKIKESLFPNHHLQERQQSFLPAYFENGNTLIAYLIANYKAEGINFYLIEES